MFCQTCTAHVPTGQGIHFVPSPSGLGQVRKILCDNCWKAEEPSEEKMDAVSKKRRGRPKKIKAVPEQPQAEPPTEPDNAAAAEGNQPEVPEAAQ